MSREGNDSMNVYLLVFSMDDVRTAGRKVWSGQPRLAGGVGDGKSKRGSLARITQAREIGDEGRKG